MLNQESLAQLKGLKNQMEAQKERAEAVIKGTQARYGFAVLDDGREIFIPPDEMLKAFPQDRVRVCIRPAKDNRTVADIEKLLESPLEDFVGQCVTKGKAVFVQPDLPHINRWLFIPPHARNGVQEGDYVRCALLRHPIRDGKPQAKVLSILGNPETAGIENLYCQTKFRLQNQWPESTVKGLQEKLATMDPLNNERRRDLTDLEFVSIDAARTQDIDDALYADISSEGWTLFVAIADPTAYIEPGSDLQNAIAGRANSVYFHGDVLPMLPEILSQDTCALTEGADRTALVCKIAVKDSGEVSDFEFIEASVRSRAKLSYYAVDRYLTGDDRELMSHATPLEALYQVYRALRAYREQHELVMEERQEYRWVLDDRKKIQSIEPSEKLLSQKLVEECMIATNRCAAAFLSAHERAGPFIGHAGFRSDRMTETSKFLETYLPQLKDSDPTQLETYREIIRAANNSQQTLPLRAMLNRLMARAELTSKPRPHMGMSLPAYTNCTSPLRKYTDFLVHQQIKSTLHGDAAGHIDESVLAALSDHLATTREATGVAEQWLASDYMLKLAESQDTFNATVSHINSSGFYARLVETGLEGFVDLRKDAEKFSFDKLACTLTSTTRRFQLNQPLEVKFLEVEKGSRQILFGIEADCGLKNPPVAKAAAPN